MSSKVDALRRAGLPGFLGADHGPPGLVPILLAVHEAFETARGDPWFISELLRWMRDFSGRETPLCHARGLSSLLGRTIYLKREDLLHAGGCCTDSTLGQLLLARRMGKRRIIAQAASGPHGVATAMTGAALGLSVEIYMGAADMPRQRPDIMRMQLLGARVHAVHSGAAARGDALDAAMQDWMAHADTSFHCFGCDAGPFPYPMIGRYFQSMAGMEAVRQFRELAGRLPAAVFAGLGAQDKALGLFAGFEPYPAVGLFGALPGQGFDGERPQRAGAGADRADATQLQALMGGHRARGHHEALCGAAGAGHAAAGPELAALAHSGRATLATVDAGEAIEALERLCLHEGIIASLESALALGLAIRVGRDCAPGSHLLVCLSGRGDRQLD